MAAILADNNFRCIFLNENDGILIRISLKFVPRISKENKPVLFQVMAWCRTGDTPLPEQMQTQFTDMYAALGGYELKKLPLAWIIPHQLGNKPSQSERLSLVPLMEPKLTWNIDFL